MSWVVSNAQARTVTKSSEAQEMNALSEWTAKFIDKIPPRGFMIEKWQYTDLHTNIYMQGLSQTHVSYCAYGRPMQNPTTLFHKGNFTAEIENMFAQGTA